MCGCEGTTDSACCFNDCMASQAKKQTAHVCSTAALACTTCMGQHALHYLHYFEKRGTISKAKTLATMLNVISVDPRVLFALAAATGTGCFAG